MGRRAQLTTIQPNASREILRPEAGLRCHEREKAYLPMRK
jgi:hypothetical protein